MDRQKPRVNRTIDGFSRAPTRPHYFVNDLSRTAQLNKAAVNTNNRPMPHLQPLPVPYPGSIPAIKPQATIQPGINRSQPSRALPRMDVTPPSSANNSQSLNSATSVQSRKMASWSNVPEKDQSSLIGTALPTTAFSRPAPENKKAKSKWRSPKRIAKTVAITFAVLALAFGGWFGSNLLGNINKVFHGNLMTDAQAFLSSSKLNGESSGRVNILLAGYQGSESDEGPLTDSIMVVSLDTQNNTAFTMSIPRDLWVNIPGMGNEKINAANTNTNFNKPGYFKGGMGQLQEVIEKDFGIPINYYALIDYAAFEDAVNAVGGITVNIQSPDPRGLYDPNVDKAHGGPVKLPNGPVKLNGLSALALALARGDSPYSYGFPLSDINRTQHQRQMLIALEKKATSAGVLSNPITISRLVSSLGNNVTTDLTLSNVLRAAQLVRKVNMANIKSYGLNYSGSNALLTTYTAPDGEDALVPRAGIYNYSQIQQFYKQITSSNPIVQESPTVTLLNASNVTGLAAREKQVLENKGFDVVDIANASTEYPTTMIVDNTNGKKPAADSALKSAISGTVVNTSSGSAEAGEAANYSSDYVVIMGKDWDASATSSVPVQN